MSAAVSLISQLDELRWRDGHLTPHPCTYAHAPTLQGAPSPPHTHALEQVTDYDGKADIWSLGITAIEMAQVHFRLAVAVCVWGRWSLGITAIEMAQVHFRLAVAVCVCGRWSLGIAAIEMAQVKDSPSIALLR